MGAGSNIYRAAERRLLDAIRAGVVCDFTDGAGFTADEMGSWGPERTIRATLLRRLLSAEDAQYAADGIHLRGAVVEGVLDLRGLNVMNLNLKQCRIAALEASHTTFTGDASFDNTTFAGDAWFDNTTFTGHAWFDSTTFTLTALFDGATFTRGARFFRANVICKASFDGATFTGDASFDHTTFTRGASFSGATFNGDANFRLVTFTGDADFGGAAFAGDADFWSVNFTEHALFARATFTSTVDFFDAIAHVYNFDRAQFHTTDPGPWIARWVTLTGAVFHVRARVAIAAIATDCRRLQAREGVHLIFRGGAVDLEDAEFLRRSILAHSTSEPALPERSSHFAAAIEVVNPGEPPDWIDVLISSLAGQEKEQRTAWAAAFQLAQGLADELGPQKTTPTRVASLRRATAGELVLSGSGLDDCAFAGAHSLDKLRINATCSFQRPPAWPRKTWRPFTGRQVIFEEAQWRQAHTQGWAPTSTTLTANAKPNDPVPTALEIAGIYRDLRKGLEDAKDEPGAADFYYGEMEMRRLAARSGRRRRNDGDETKGRLPSWTERRLLDAYWAVSGYGLRAWRAVTALAILLVGCAVLFTLPCFAHLPAVPQHVASVKLATGVLNEYKLEYKPGAYPGDKPDTSATVTFAKSLEFTARESLTLTRASGDPLLKTTGAGTALDIALRLLAPLLLGLAVLAVRGRTKR